MENLKSRGLAGLEVAILERISLKGSGFKHCKVTPDFLLLPQKNLSGRETHFVFQKLFSNPPHLTDRMN